MGKLKAKWFRHEAGLVDSLAITEAIDENGIAAYAAYCIILERLTLEPEKAATLKSLLSLSRKYGIDRQVINNVVLNYNLFHYDKETDMVFCAELNESLEQQERISERYRDNGRKGGKPPKETKEEPNLNQTETKTEPNDNQNVTKPEPNRIELNRIEENRTEQSIKHSIDLNLSQEEKKEKEKKEVPSKAADSAPIHVVAQHGTKSRKKKLNLKREGFFIQGVKAGEPYELEVTDVKQPEIVEWLQKNINSFIAQQEDWLTKDHIWKLWKAFFEKEKVGYSNDWAGLHTHFCNCIKKARRSEFTTGYQQPSKPQKHVKPELKPNRPPEGYFDQTLPIDNPRDADAIVAYMIEQEAIEKAQQEALKNKQNG